MQSIAESISVIRLCILVMRSFLCCFDLFLLFCDVYQRFGGVKASPMIEKIVQMQSHNACLHCKIIYLWKYSDGTYVHLIRAYWRIFSPLRQNPGRTRQVVRIPCAEQRPDT